MKILLSACLLGIHCRYDGKEKRNDALLKCLEGHQTIPFCPEIYGGLATPREPAEIRDGRVYTRSGADVTQQYERGAREAIKLCRLLQCDCAILQDRSPSCGKGSVHNGAFDGGMVSGHGVAARSLLDAGVPVYSAGEIIALGSVPQGHF